MFKKLKEKITEEVKSSPQRIQQFTQSVSDRLQNSTASDENFFSIGDDDSANTSLGAASFEAGFSNVSLMSPPPQEIRPRRTSTSSMASDVSFLPRYESIANMYHLQSDLDISASELEDNASNTSSSQLGHLSKEQIYTAFQKSQMRYHKYRGRYTDLAKHYRDLEREITKIKSVLVETQDKAIRRVTELKEQCSLEQKAKAHLESALRDELDEKQFKIEALETKIGLLRNQNGVETQQNGADFDSLTKYLNEARLEIENLNEKLQEMKANSIIFQSKEVEYKNRISSLEVEVANFSEREKENNLRLGQTKMELHNELLSKEAELANYKQDNEVLRQNLEAFETKSNNSKLDNLQSQNRKLIEKLEMQTMKIQSHEQDLIKLEQNRIEIHNLKEINSKLNSDLMLIESERNEIEEKLTKVREDTKKSLLSLEEKIRIEIRLEFEEREKHFKEEVTEVGDFGEKQLELVEKSAKIDELSEKVDSLEKELARSKQKYQILEENYLKLIEESNKLRSNSDFNDLKMKYQRLEEEYATLDSFNKELETKLRLFEEKDYALNLDKTEAKLLESKLQKMEEENVALLESFENERKVFENLLADNSKLLESDRKVKSLESDLSKVQNEYAICQSNSNLMEVELSEVNQEKIKLDDLNRKLEEKVRIFEEKDVANCLEISECKLLELKLQKMEEERKNLLESFENERIVFESIQNDNSQLKEAETRLKICEDNYEKLESELKQVQENFDKQNFEFRALESEKSRLEDSVRNYEEKIRIFEEKNEAIELEITESRLLEMKLQKLEEEKANLTETFEKEQILQESNLMEKTHELNSLKNNLKEVENQVKSKDEELGASKLKLAETTDSLENLRSQVEHSRSEFDLQTSVYDDERAKIVRENQLMTSQLEETSNLLRIKEDAVDKYENFIAKITMNHQNCDLDAELLKILNLLNNLEEIENVKSKLERKIDELLETQTSLLEEKSKLVNSLDELEKRNSQINSDNQFLTDENNNLTSEIEQLKLTLETVKNDLKTSEDSEDIKAKFDELLCDNERLRQDNVKLGKDSLQVTEMEKHLSELQHEKQLLLDEIAELKTSPVNRTNDGEEKCVREIDSLRDKLTQYKSLDLTNRTSIAFYEDELQKVKNQNEKLTRKLDETIVTLNHCTELSSGSTEIEYLRNVLYNYMLGKEGLVLARVIAAVCKFDQQQTETVLAKEQQKQTLLGQLGII